MIIKTDKSDIDNNILPLTTRRIKYDNNIKSIDNTNNNILTKDFFMRKTEINFIKKSLSPIKSNNHNLNINYIKSDIIQIDNIIKNNTDILIYYKQIKEGLITHFYKKCKDIQINNTIDISNYFNKIEENSHNITYLLNDYRCKSKEDLIYKMALENYLNQLYINKIDDLCFLLNLKYNNDNNDIINNYSDTLSKLKQLKLFIDKKNKLHNDSNKSINRIYNNEDEFDFSKILEFNSIYELINLNNNNQIICHLKNLFNQLNDKAIKIFADFITNKTINKIRKTDDLIETFLLLRKYIEDIFQIKEDELKDITNKYENLKIEYNKIKNNNLNNIYRETNNLLNKIENDNIKLIEKLKDYDNSNKNKLYEEIKKLYIQIDELKTANEILTHENKYLTKQTNLYNKEKINTNYKNKHNIQININTLSGDNLNDSYDQLVQEQFNTMKDSFILKINLLNQELNLFVIENKKIQEELRQYKLIKEVFIYQIADIRKYIGNLNI